MLDYDAVNRDVAGKPLVVVIDGRGKPFRTVLSDRDYSRVRALGAEYRSRNPRPLGKQYSATR